MTLWCWAKDFSSSLGRWVEVVLRWRWNLSSLRGQYALKGVYWQPAPTLTPAKPFCRLFSLFCLPKNPQALQATAGSPFYKMRSKGLLLLQGQLQTKANALPCRNLQTLPMCCWSLRLHIHVQWSWLFLVFGLKLIVASPVEYPALQPLSKQTWSILLFLARLSSLSWVLLQEWEKWSLYLLCLIRRAWVFQNHSVMR